MLKMDYWPTGHGIDIVDLNRNEFNDLEFSKRYMTPAEYEYGKIHFADNQLARRNYNAAIWSLKEAIIKATNHEVIFSKIEIKLTSEAPQCQLENFHLLLSLSFERTMIIASAIAYKIDSLPNERE